MTTIELPPPTVPAFGEESPDFWDEAAVRLAIEQDRARPVPGEDELMQLAQMMAETYLQRDSIHRDARDALRAVIRQALRQPAVSVPASEPVAWIRSAHFATPKGDPNG